MGSGVNFHMRILRKLTPDPISVAASLLASLVLAASWSVVGHGQGSPALPIEPVKETGQSVTGAFEGWYENSDGSYTLLVGYFNRNSKQTLDIPVGPDNRIEPGGPDLGQPTYFQPRRQWGVFTVIVPKDFGKQRLTWTIVANGQTTTVPLHIDPLWIVAPFKDVALGNTPPSLRLTAEGAALQGPPKGISATYTATVSTPLALNVWASDDGIRAPEARRPARLVSVSWSKFRGPGDVTFSSAAPAVDEKTGEASTTATFSASGEYILRVQVNDATGEGGGGFQCCWTNAHVKVTVK
jgi:hypothetical protein